MKNYKKIVSYNGEFLELRLAVDTGRWAIEKIVCDFLPTKVRELGPACKNTGTHKGRGIIGGGVALAREVGPELDKVRKLLTDIYEA